MESSLAGFGLLSKRGRKTVGLAPEYFAIASQAWEDLYDENSNPDGFIDFGVAENRLSLPLVADALSRTPSVPSEYLTYGGMGGKHRFRQAVAALFARFTHFEVSPEHLCLAAGASSVIDLVVTCLCDEGDKVLTTTPVYRGFIGDVKARAGGELELAPLLEENGFAISADLLDRAWNAAGGDLSGIKAVLLASPNNPTGEVLSREVVADIVQWSESHNLHLIMDEIYALSVFSESATFVSVADVMKGQLGNLVHIVWSFSKDFALSGCRLGVLYTHNVALRRAFSELSYLADSSRLAEWAVMHILEDHEWLDSYLIESRARLLRGYKSFTSLLDELRIPYLTSEAGFFVCINVRNWMRDVSEKEEREIWMEMCAAKVFCIPAAQMLCDSYGWFRCCFSASEEKLARIGLRRLEKLLRAREATNAANPAQSL